MFVKLPITHNHFIITLIYYTLNQFQLYSSDHKETLFYNEKEKKK